MQALTRALFVGFGLAACALSAATSNAQDSKKTPTGSISGRVTLGEKPVPRATVMLTPSDRTVSMLQRTPTVRATTDEDGRYKLTGIPPGSYNVLPNAPAFVASEGSSAQAGQTVTLNEGEDAEDVDFSLKRGGVVTGRVTDADGRPVIGERVVLMRVNERGQNIGGLYYTNAFMFSTDDRGIYRLYGIAPGRYKVSLGDAPGSGNIRIGFGAGGYARTFHPDVADEARATIIEVTPGGEAAGIDIAMGRAAKTYAVTGRVVDAETGAAVPNVRCGYGPIIEGRNALGSFGWTDNRSNINGEFHIQGLPPGRHAAFVVAEEQSEFYSEAAVFDITDTDVSGLEIRVRRGASISGVAVLEGTDDPEALAKLSKIELRAFVQTEGLSAPAGGSNRVGAGGNFRIGGLRPGKVRMQIGNYPPIKGFALQRIERDGVDQRDGIEIGAGEQVTGLRVVIGYGNGIIRGQVQTQGGPKPPDMRFRVVARRLGVPALQTPFFTDVDVRGRFTLDGLAPGEYELTAMASVPSLPTSAPSPPGQMLRVTQNVSVSSGAQAEVTLVINLAPQGRTGR